MLPFKRLGEGDMKPAGETLQFDVKGPNGGGIVSVVATSQADGTYRAATITVTFDDGTTIDVPVPREMEDER
jgi:hypothetical protein